MTDGVDLQTVSSVLRAHLGLYRWRAPVYQATMLEALRSCWGEGDRRVLDVGGGTGVIAQTISDLFPVDRVVSVDVEDRFLPTLTIEHAAFDGRRLPFADGEFDCVVFNNVIHHVQPQDRVALLRECRRVAPTGAVFVKDHLAETRLDHLRLTALDAIGNVPFHGMIKANYLSLADWRALAADAGYAISSTTSSTYRRGLVGAVFPNDLEVLMRWDSLDAG